MTTYCPMTVHLVLCGHDCPDCNMSADDPLIMCEECGQDILQSTAIWRDTDDGRVPYCAACNRRSPDPDRNPFD